jgi:hypothetical protein
MPEPDDEQQDGQPNMADDKPEKLIFGSFPTGDVGTIDMKKNWPEVEAYHQKFVEADKRASQRKNMVGGWTLPPPPSPPDLLPLPPPPDLPESQAGDLTTGQSENSD